MSRSRRVLQALGLAVVVLVAAAGINALAQPEASNQEDAAAPSFETTVASITTVSDTAELAGELRYQDSVDLVHRVDAIEVIIETQVPIETAPAADDARGAGAPVEAPQFETVPTTTLEPGFRTITDLPSRGETILFGEVLYETDSTPVILAPGEVAAWRTMTLGTTGEDVAQLQRFLIAAAFADSTLVDDGVWGADTTTAVQDWQEATGQTISPSVELGDIWFASTPVRITEVATSVGIVVGDGDPLFTYTSTNRAVEASVTELPDGLLDAEELSARLPDGTTSPATLRSVRGTDEGFDLILDVDLSSADISDVNGLEVTTSWVTSELVDALTLPPEAIRRMEDGRYVVDVLDGEETRTVVVEVLGQAGRIVAVSGVTEAELIVIP